MYQDERDTEDSFLEPELSYRTGTHGKTRVPSCDDLLSLKTQEHEGINKYVVLVGNPGTGKSTVLRNRLAYDWAKGTKHTQIKLLFVIDMHNIEPHSDLIDIIENQLLKNEPKEELRQLIQENAQSIAFLLDSFDEAPQAWEGKQSGLSVVMKRQWLQDCHVIVTTRSNKLDKFCTSYQGYTTVDISGFSIDTVRTFVRKIISTDTDTGCADLFWSDFQAYPKWASWLKTNPLTLSMLCVLWKSKKELPTGITSLYKNVINYLRAHHEQTNNESGEASVDSHNETTMAVVSKYAFRDLLGQKQRFDPSIPELKFAIQ